MGYHESAYWLDVGTPQTLCAAPATWCCQLLPRRCPARPGPRWSSQAPRWRGRVGLQRHRGGRGRPRRRRGDGLRQRALRLGHGGQGRRGARLDPRPRRGRRPGPVVDEAVIGDGAGHGPGNEWRAASGCAGVNRAASRGLHPLLLRRLTGSRHSTSSTADTGWPAVAGAIPARRPPHPVGAPPRPR